MELIFVPHELKTIEVDTEKKIFKINGEEFGRDCAGFTITCRRYDNFMIRVEANATIRYVSIENGKCVSDTERPNNDPWFPALAECGNQ